MKTYVTLSLLVILLSTNAFTQAPRKARRSTTPQANVSRSLDFSKFVGVWEFTPDPSNGTGVFGKGYFKVTEEQLRRFRFTEGFEYQGNISWAETMVNHADGIYLKPLNGKLEGRFTSPNFRATHGHEFTYRITLALGPDARLLYSISSGLESERYHATKISNVNGYQASPQSTFSRKELANQSWAPFWLTFSNAVYKKDFKTLVQLSASDFFDGLGLSPAMDWFKMMSPQWHLVKKAVMSGTRPLELGEENLIERITNDGEMIFRFEKDNKWRFSSLMGD